MRAYRYAGFTLTSSVALPELPPAPRRTGDVRIVMSGRRSCASRGAWEHRWRFPSGRVRLNLASAGGRRLLQFPGLCEFEIERDTISCHPAADVPPITVRHLLLDQVLPALLGSDRRLVLHASAVVLDGSAAAFLGAAGTGKSTIAAALALDGASTLTDDALVIRFAGRRALADPTYPGIRLWPSSRRLLGVWARARHRPVAHYTTKQRWSGSPVRFSGTPARVRHVFLLTPGKAAGVRLLSGRMAIMAMLRHMMMLDVHDGDAGRRGLELAGRAASGIAVCRLVLPRGAAGLAAACAQVRDYVGRSTGVPAG
ncbi:MAG: hypothetical protein IT176_11700 [Acidobacteria bacterium]|nr:hypothetical protein [Acidobacteriota bacterium]